MEQDVATALRTVTEATAELERTILVGWPESFGAMTSQAYDEAEMIEATFHELCLHLPDLDTTSAWTIAGNIVARFRRDLLNQSP